MKDLIEHKKDSSSHDFNTYFIQQLNQLEADQKGQELIENIKRFDGSLVLEDDFNEFIEREIGPNKGAAGEAFASRIERLLNSD